MSESTFFDKLMLIIEQKNGTCIKDICSHKPTTDATWARIIATKNMLAYGFDKSQIATRLNVSYNSIANYVEKYDNMYNINAAFREIANSVDIELKK